MRVILYTGKGGVGKTSIAAATALKLADEGKKVLIMSTDQAHSLSDSFGVKLNSEPLQIIERLEALEIDVVAESERAWGNLRGFMKEMLSSRAEGGIEAEELLVFPGLEELFALFKILDIFEEKSYDVLIVDCAPTGETLTLLKYPEMFGEIFEKVMPLKRKMVKAVGPVVQKVTKIPMPKDNVFDDLTRLMDKLERLQRLMQNKEQVSVRIVTTPEKIVIKETKRNFTFLQMFDYNVDAIITNKVYPKEALEGYFNQWVKLQEEGLREIETSFYDVPRFTVMLQKHELRTVEVLREVNGFYGEVHPDKVLFSRKIFSVTQEGDRHKMEIYLPFAEKSEMDLGQKNGELQLAIKNEKRCFSLPETLKGKGIESAKFEQGTLVIWFT